MSAVPARPMLLTRSRLYDMIRTVSMGEQTYSCFYSETLGEMVGIYRDTIPEGYPEDIRSWYSVSEMQYAMRLSEEELKRFHYFKRELIG